MTLVSIAKNAQHEPVVMLVNASTPEGGRITAGLAFFYRNLKQPKLVLRCLETKRRYRVRVPKECRNLGVPRCLQGQSMEII